MQTTTATTPFILALLPPHSISVDRTTVHTVK